MGIKLTGVKKASATKRARALSCSIYVSDLYLYWLAATHEKLHFRNLLVNLFHEMYDEINQLVFQHGFGMKIGDQKRNIVTL